MNHITYIYHTDPGHGWLEVSRAEVERLGLLGEISHYSYQRNGTLYLEEDCDMSRFLAAKDAAGEPFQIVERYAEHTFVRGLPSFSGGHRASLSMGRFIREIQEGGIL